MQRSKWNQSDHQEMYIYKNTENKNHVADKSCTLLRNAGNYLPLSTFGNTVVKAADLII
jgi:hypothetical protein